MTEETKRCLALTKAGTQCKNTPQEGSDFCYVHEQVTNPKIVPPASPANQDAPVIAEVTPSSPDEAELKALVTELNKLVAELEERMPGYTPPPYSPQKLKQLLTGNIDKFTPEVVRDLQANFEGTTVQDFLDPDTWKGMWYVLNYMAESETKSLRENITTRLKTLPGVNALVDWLR